MVLAKLKSRLRELPQQKIIYYEGAKLASRSYPELARDVEQVVEHLGAGGVRAGMYVGLLAPNCYEWAVYDLALLELGAITVALPMDFFGNDAPEELAQRFGLSLLLVGRGAQRLPQPWVCPIEVGPLAAFELRTPGEGERHPPEDDLLSLVFSSGTSGRLKCLKMSRRGTEAFIESFGREFAFRPDDAILAFLPLSTVQQRWMLYTAVHYGFNLHLTTPPRLFHALKDMRPTMIGAAPLLYETVESRYHALPRRQRALLDVLRAAVRRLPPRLRTHVGRRVFKPFHDAFGGRLRFALAGAAPIRMSTLQFFDSIGLPLYSAYGLTETGFLSWNMPGRDRMGSVGKEVYPGTLEIAPDGEILFHGSTSIAFGYLGVDEEEERRTFVAPGTVATGDIGRFDEDGYLYIVGRKKDIIITPGGFKVQPEDLERALEEVTEVSRAVVLGGESLPCITAVVSKREGADESASERIRREVHQINQRLPPPSRIGKVVITEQQFTMDSGLLNRNLKIDRRRVLARFQAEMGAVEA